MNFGRLYVITTNVFREVVRDRILFMIGIYIIILSIAIYLLPQFAATAKDKMFLDFALAAMNLLGLVVAIFVGTGLINKEIEKRTVLVLIAKPISRAELIVGKYLGLLTLLAVLITAMTIITFVFLLFSQVSYSVASVLIAVLFLFLQLSLITSVAITLGVFTSSLLATVLTFAVYLMGNISQDVLKLGRLSSKHGIETFTQALYLILPDLSRLDVKNDAIYGLAALPNSMTLISNIGYGLLYSLMLLAIAILIFSQREF